MKRIKNYPRKTFKHAVVAVDLVIFTVGEGGLEVLLLELTEGDFSGKKALPGGLVTQRETLEDAVRRHLREKAGIEEVYLEQLYTFGDPKRDPSGWVVSVAYMALVHKAKVKPKASARYGGIEWYRVGALPGLAYDHPEIVQVAVDRLRAKLAYTNIVYGLMPGEFTLTELQGVYETILGKRMDKRNFRKKMLALELLRLVAGKRKGEAHRPAQLYAFKEKTPKIVEIL